MKKKGLKLNTKLTWVLTSLIALTVLISVLVTFYFGNQMVERTIAQKLSSSQLIQDEFVTQKTRQLELVSLVVASDPAFVAYIAQTLIQLDNENSQVDTSSIADLLLERKQQYGFDMAIIASVDGTQIARSDQPVAPQRDLTNRPLMQLAQQELIPLSGYWQEGTQFYQTAIVPLARGSNLIGFLITGTEINDAMTADIKQLTGTEILISHVGEQQNNILAGTFNVNQKQVFKEKLNSLNFAIDSTMAFELPVNDENYQVRLLPMSEELGLYYVNAIDSRQILAPFIQTRNTLIIIGIILIVLAYIIAGVVVKSTLAPLRKISAATQKIAQGEYAAEFPDKVSADLATLNHAVTQLANDIRGRESLAKHMVLLSKQSQTSISPKLEKDLITPGKILGGRFKILQSIGVGGMGAVFKAIDEELDEVVALKVLKNKQISETDIEQFKDEIKMARRISHPNVVRIHDYGQLGDKVFISMEYVQGFTLQQIIKHSKKLRPFAARHAAIHICYGLRAAHQAGVIHRDLKPANIIVELDTSIKLMDFGIASVDHSIGSKQRHGEIGGTLGYISPEQAEGKGSDERTDIYALGVLLMEMFVGKRPFYDRDPEQLMLKHVSETPPSMRELWADVPNELDQLIAACLAKNPADRPQSVQEVLQKLKEIQL